MRSIRFIPVALLGLAAACSETATNPNSVEQRPVGPQFVAPDSTQQTGGLHFVGTPDVTATKTDLANIFLTATGEVAGAGTTATATLAANVEIVTGCINPGSKDQQPKGLRRTTATTAGQLTFNTRSGRGTFTVSTQPANASRTCPGQDTPVLVSATFTDVTLTITSGGKTVTAFFPDIDP
jgi:hypothetical protein